jgi:threonine synthase
MYQANNRVAGFSCLRCGAMYSIEQDYPTGCPVCLADGYPVSLKVEYGSVAFHVDMQARGLFRYVDRLPYKTFPTLGEGNTPLFELSQWAEELHLGGLFVKNEGQNPTGSHKDRMSPFAVARAVELGKTTVVAASSGNAGASLAAYAAAAGVRCVIITTEKMNPIWSQAIHLTGAELVAAGDPKDRWKYMQQMVETEGWYPVTNYIDPPTGSNSFGVQGYKTVAYEIVEQCGTAMPTVIVVPSSRGDLLWGIYEGLREMLVAGRIEKMPRLIVVEPIARVSRVLDGADYREDFAGDSGYAGSIGGSTVTYQVMQAVTESGGTAVVVSGEQAQVEQRELAKRGLYWEGSSATALGAVKQLATSGEIGLQDRVLLIATSNGYKDFPQKTPPMKSVNLMQ